MELEGVLWILRTGAQWSELLRDKFPPYQTCHRRFQQWVRAGTLVKVLRGLAEDLLARGQLDLAETFIDASFSGAKKGAVQLVQHAAAKGARSWQSRTAMVFLSPWGLQALRLMRPSSSRPRSSNGSPEKGRSV
jgi:transposase